MASDIQLCNRKLGVQKRQVEVSTKKKKTQKLSLNERHEQMYWKYKQEKCRNN